MSGETAVCQRAEFTEAEEEAAVGFVFIASCPLTSLRAELTEQRRYSVQRHWGKTYKHIKGMQTEHNNDHQISVQPQSVTSSSFPGQQQHNKLIH